MSYIIHPKLSEYVYTELEDNIIEFQVETSEDTTIEVLVDTTLPKQSFAAGETTLTQYESDVLGYLISTLENIV